MGKVKSSHKILHYRYIENKYAISKQNKCITPQEATEHTFNSGY